MEPSAGPYPGNALDRHPESAFNPPQASAPRHSELKYIITFHPRWHYEGAVVTVQSRPGCILADSEAGGTFKAIAAKIETDTGWTAQQDPHTRHDGTGVTSEIQFLIERNHSLHLMGSLKMQCFPELGRAEALDLNWVQLGE